MASQVQYLDVIDSSRLTVVSASYSDSLQNRQFRDAVSWHITEQVKRLITANDQALSAQIRQIGEANRPRYEVRLSIEKLQKYIVKGFARAGSIVEWGFNELVMPLTRTNDLLSDMLLTAKTPSEAWAFEQFERARNEYRRGLYAEALESLNHAITGFANNAGHKSEHRFHFLRGLVYFGGRLNTSPEIVDLAKAKDSFKECARYAIQDFPLEAASALLFAARAANLLGDYEEARELACEGLGWAGLELAGLHYEAARALINLDQEDLAADHALEAIRLDKMLILMVSGESDFVARSGFVERILTAAREDAKEHLSSAAKHAQLEIEKIKNVKLEISTFDKMYTITGALSDEISDLDSWVKDNFTTISEGGAFDMRTSLEKFPAKYNELHATEEKFCTSVQSDLRNLLTKYRDKSALEKEDLRHNHEISNKVLNEVPILVGIGVFIPGFIYSIWQYREGDIGGQLSTITGALMALFIFCMILKFATVLVKYILRKSYNASIKDLYSADENYNSEINHAVTGLELINIYSPSKDVVSLLPRWCMGLKDRPLFGYNRTYSQSMIRHYPM